MSPDYALALATGLLGGFGHCTAMCGPLVAGLALRAGAGLPALAAYHAGRLATYAFLGAVTGFAGSFVKTAGRLAGLQDAVALLAGAAMVVVGLGIAGLPRVFRGPAWAARPWGRLAPALLDTGAPAQLFPLGLLFGLLPCGLSSTALLMAASTASPVAGSAVVLLFGLGTVPALAIVGLAAGRVSARARGALYRLGGVAVAATGLLSLHRGIAARAGL